MHLKLKKGMSSAFVGGIFFNNETVAEVQLSKPFQVALNKTKILVKATQKEYNDYKKSQEEIAEQGKLTRSNRRKKFIERVAKDEKQEEKAKPKPRTRRKTNTKAKAADKAKPAKEADTGTDDAAADGTDEKADK